MTLPTPDHATSNMKLVGYSDQDGRCDGVQIMVHRGFAYVKPAYLHAGFYAESYGATVG